MKCYSLDTESEYSKDLSLTIQGSWQYARLTNNYMLTVAGEDGYEYVGGFKEFDWSLLKGQRVCMANAPYDLTVLGAEIEKGNIPADALEFGDVVDTLDLAKYLGRPGSLAGACQSLLGIEMSKDTRNSMKNKSWATMSEEFKQEVREYALKDAKLTLQLWLEHGEKWPWHEREISRMNRDMCLRGIPVDVERAEGYVTHLKRIVWEAANLIPWAKEDDAKILSPKALAEECRKVGIIPPKSLAQDSEECAAWEDKYGEQYPWIGAMRDWRRANILLKKLETLLARVRPDGTFQYGLRYFGSSVTGRFSGDSGFSMLNLPRTEMYGVDLRSVFKAPEGYKFIILDFSSLEPRIGGYLSGDWGLLNLLADPHADLYEAHARTSMGYTDPRPLKQYDKDEGTEIRKLAKARILGASYGASGDKFVTIAKTMANLDLSPADADIVVKAFRRQNKKVVDTWDKLYKSMRMRAGRGDFTVELPSGRVLTYFDVSSVGDGLSAVTCRVGKMMRSRWWGSVLYNNCVQGTAREVLAEKLLQLELEHGIPACLHVHDEILALVREEEAEEKFNLMSRVMSEAPSFMPGLPLATEGVISERYCK